MTISKLSASEQEAITDGVSEHEPIGSVNLARKKIYQELAKYRREEIEKRLREPQPFGFVQDEPR